METRITITSIDDFIALLKITNPDEKEIVFSKYKIILSNLIRNSIDLLADFWSKLDEQLRKQILKNHPEFLTTPFDTIENFNIAKVKHRDFILKIITNDLKAAISSMYTDPAEVIKFFESDSALASTIFGWIPCSKILIQNHQYFNFILKKSKNTALGMFLKTTDEFFQQPNLELFFILLERFNNLPSERNSYSTSVWFTTPNGASFEVKELFKKKIENFIKDNKNLSFRTLLLQRKNFLKLDTLGFSRIILSLPGVSFVNILFENQITYQGLCGLIESHPAFVKQIVEKFPVEVGTTIKKTTEFRYLYDKLSYPLQEKLYISPLIANSFAKSTDFDDWKWVVRHSSDRDWISDDDIFEKIKKENSFEIRRFFSSLENIEKLLIMNPALVVRTINWIMEIESSERHENKLANRKARREAKLQGTLPDVEEVLPPSILKVLFPSPANYLEFLVKHGNNDKIDAFTKMVLENNPQYLRLFYDQTNHFQALPKRVTLLLTSGYTRIKEVIKWLEETGDIDSALKNYPHIFNDYDFQDKPYRLLKLAKNSDDMFALMNCEVFKQDGKASTNLSHYRAIDYVKSAECRIPVLLQSSISPSDALLKLIAEFKPVFWLLLEHHSEKLLSMLNYDSFMQLGAYERNPFISKHPKIVGEFFTSPKANLKDLKETLDYFAFKHNRYDSSCDVYHQRFAKMFDLNPKTFCEIFKKGSVDEKVEIARFFPGFLDLLYKNNVVDVAQAFSGMPFIKLLQQDVLLAQTLLEQFKDYVDVLIPTREDFINLQHVNELFLKKFATAFPSSIQNNPIFDGLLPQALPSLNNPNVLWRAPTSINQNAPTSDLLNELNVVPSYTPSYDWWV